DGLCRDPESPAGGVLAASRRERLLRLRVRYRVRHGGPRRRRTARHPDFRPHPRPLGRGGGRRELCAHAHAAGRARRVARAALALLPRPRGRGRDDGPPLAADPQPHPQRLLRGLPAQQLGRDGGAGGHRGELCGRAALAMTDPGPAIARFDFPRGGPLRGSYLTLYPNCLVHQGGGLLETLPLRAIASVRVAFERDERKLRWGIGFIVVALVLFAVAAPLGSFAASAAGEMAGAGGQGVARLLQGFFSALQALSG